MNIKYCPIIYLLTVYKYYVYLFQKQKWLEMKVQLETADGLR